ncbi:hypothetical protein E0Z10_g7354 [Xylaria hypoxylon]|uniref:Protein kinase domain-containing protein n=1 Tax=Xylaria hypoxylon TaxID=37992 RepID=A0A4Z0YSI4_9PEZI|nr:hypothetical protein E0Z10_g7354 [Xylaria hypoxylon]
MFSFFKWLFEWLAARLVGAMWPFWEIVGAIIYGLGLLGYIVSALWSGFFSILGETIIFTLTILRFRTADRHPTDIYKLKFDNALQIAHQRSIHGNATDVCIVLNNDRERTRFVSVGYDVYQYAELEWKYEKSRVIGMPFLPTGDWNTADIGMDDKHIVITKTSCESLPSMDSKFTWNPVMVDLFEFTVVPAPWATYRTKLVTHPYFDNGAKAVLKVARFRSEIERMEIETSIYKALLTHNLAPRVFGHVKDDNRIVGSIYEYIEALPVDKDNFDASALELCEIALGDLHGIYIAHGDAHPRNCLLRHDGTAVWIGFGWAKRTKPDEKEAFEKDFHTLHLGYLDLQSS